MLKKYKWFTFRLRKLFIQQAFFNKCCFECVNISKNRSLIELLYLELTDSRKIADCVGVGGFSPNPHTSYLGPHALKVKNISHNVPIGRGFVTHIFYYVQFFYIILSSCMYYTCTVYVVYSPFQLVLAQLLYYTVYRYRYYPNS